MVTKLVKLMSHEDIKIKQPVFYVLSFLCEMDKEQASNCTDCLTSQLSFIMKSGLLMFILQDLKHHDKTIQEKSIVIVRNLSKISPKTLNSTLAAGVFPIICEVTE